MIPLKRLIMIELTEFYNVDGKRSTRRTAINPEHIISVYEEEEFANTRTLQTWIRLIGFYLPVQESYEVVLDKISKFK
jgi:hypothetical protein